MTKAEEIKLARTLSEQFGPSSYLGPWLADVAAEVEREITDDFSVSPSLSATRRACAVLLDDAKRQADEILKAANGRAAKIEADAADHARLIRAGIEATVRGAAKALGIERSIY